MNRFFQGFGKILNVDRRHQYLKINNNQKFHNQNT